MSRVTPLREALSRPGAVSATLYSSGTLSVTVIGPDDFDGDFTMDEDTLERLEAYDGTLSIVWLGDSAFVPRWVQTAVFLARQRTADGLGLTVDLADGPGELVEVFARELIESALVAAGDGARVQVSLEGGAAADAYAGLGVAPAGVLHRPGQIVPQLLQLVARPAVWAALSDAFIAATEPRHVASVRIHSDPGRPSVPLQLLRYVTHACVAPSSLRVQEHLVGGDAQLTMDIIARYLATLRELILAVPKTEQQALVDAGLADLLRRQGALKILTGGLRNKGMLVPALENVAAQPARLTSLATRAVASSRFA